MSAKLRRLRPPIWVELEGVHNMRDIGGYAVQGNRDVRTGIIYRSDTLENATESDIAHLKELRVGIVIDLRTIQESSESLKRYRLAADKDVDYVCLPAIPEGVMASRAFPLGDSDGIGDLYYENLLACRASFGTALRLLAAAKVPAVIHCAAGRDRTGSMSAILLSHAGVSDEEVALDYTATSARVRLLYGELARNPLYQESRISDPSELTAEPQTIYRFLDNVRAGFGSVSNLVRALAGDESAELLGKRLIGPERHAPSALI
jgi:protein-tyrosine phosphatase